MKWEKIFENHISDKELISRIYKTPIAQQKKNTNISSFRIGRVLEHTFLQRRHANDQQIYEKMFDTANH